MCRFTRARIIVAALILAGCHAASEHAEAPAPVLVTVVRVEKATVRELIETSGDFEALPGLDAKLGALVTGRLRSVSVAEGDRVVAGQVLAQVDAPPLSDAVRQAEAALAQGHTQVETATARTARSKSLHEGGVASRQDEEDARTQLAVAISAEKTAAAALDTARTQLGRAVLKAPFDGVVVRVLAAPGEPVDGSGKPLIQIAQTRALELRAGLTALQAARVKPGMKANIIVDSLPDETLEGLVVAVAPTIDPATGVGLARIRVANPSGLLKVGGFARAVLVAEVHEGALTVPKAALVPSDPAAAAGDEAALAPAVEVIQDGKAKRVTVSPGYEDGAVIEIREGLQEGQQVILQGAYALPDDTPVARASLDGGHR